MLGLAWRVLHEERRGMDVVSGLPAACVMLIVLLHARLRVARRGSISMRRDRGAVVVVVLAGKVHRC